MKPPQLSAIAMTKMMTMTRKTRRIRKATQFPLTLKGTSMAMMVVVMMVMVMVMAMMMMVVVVVVVMMDIMVMRQLVGGLGDSRAVAAHVFTTLRRLSLARGGQVA